MRVMAAVTLDSESTLVRVIFLVAADTGHRGVLEFLIGMTLGALYVLVLAQQFEAGFVVVELGLFPVFLGMAFRARRSQ